MSLFNNAFQEICLPAIMGVFEVQVTYHQGTAQATFGVLFDESDVEEYDGNTGLTLRSREINIRIPKGNLDLGAGLVEPKRSDWFTLSGGQVMRILPGRNDAPWEWSDIHENEYLVTAIRKP